MITNSYTLFEISQVDAPLYAIISPLSYPELPEYWQAFQPAASDIWQQLHFGKDAESWQMWAPIVVKIEEGKPGETLLHWLNETQPARQSGVILMHCELALQQVIDFWQQRIFCLWPDGTRALFRSYAPDVLSAWWSTLDRAAQTDFLGSLNNMYLPIVSSERGEYQLFAQQEMNNKNKNEIKKDYQINLTRYQYYLLANNNRLHRLANELFLFVSAQCVFPLDIEIVKARFISGIALAEKYYPKASEAECEAWSAHRWVLGSEFYLHPIFIHLTERYSIADSIRIFKSEPERIESVQLNYHRPGWMRGELPDITEVTL
ncbi:hypothetical protein BV924_22775 [Pectobacterium odoriferum]|uniref:DUF4123 domain-containing protein n=1 Tax=Pectobacterium odoriferum TaxID=78398 RepID=A0ABD6VJ22_9GAMM|nr:DUF4123 domain-containing protein [Pectobacterium odoriferum]KGA39653.1 hypothetical protein KU75_21330 [Pectobacterium odoriferum]POD90523.1 hypothetical protein BVY06_23315 [Pectobacterium odoriferum]POE07694.1 hypothetical protein BV924_22775 [Pectobacterium odoriferum]POE21715.1 hypothetical protein BV926_22780 [Pectobacterium odoriferum]POE26308.1 hypothetical protein BV919_22760 [Pectobacterium odoriferum]